MLIKKNLFNDSGKISDANVRLKDIDRVVLVGGATKLSFIRKFVGKLFHNLPDTSINPDEAVALGAVLING